MARHRMAQMTRAVAIAAVLAVAPPRIGAADPPVPNDAVPVVPDAKPVERRLRLRHHWTREEIDLVYRIGDAYQPAAMASIDRFMRDWRCDKTVAIDPKLIDRIYELQQAIGERRTIRVISAYRSEGYNASLLISGRTVDPNSQHMMGRAADLFVPGLHADKLREAAEKAGIGGVGYYPFSGPRFVHVDTGPERHWTEMDPAVRRRLGLKARRRVPFKLDCALTMAQALGDPSVADQLAALPPGAAVGSTPANAVCEAEFPLEPLELKARLAQWRAAPEAAAQE